MSEIIYGPIEKLPWRHNRQVLIEVPKPVIEASDSLEEEEKIPPRSNPIPIPNVNYRFLGEELRFKRSSPSEFGFRAEYQALEVHKRSLKNPL